MDAPIAWNSSATLTLSAFHSVNVNAGITATGNGTLDVITDNDIGGTSSGGTFNIAMGTGGVQFTTPGEGGLTVNGAPYTLIWTVPELQAVGSSGDYALATNIDAASYEGFSPIAENTPFTGTFNGLGNSVSNLTISSGDTYVGLFGQVGGGGVIENVGLLGGTVSATGNEEYVQKYIGGLVGDNSEGIITNSFATGSVGGGGQGALIGGLVGNTSGGTLTDVHATGAVSDVGGLGAAVGGLAGASSSAISDAYATGTVTLNSDAAAGGLIGSNSGPITDVSATGTVTSGDGGTIGGLAGYNRGAITNAFATGAVTDGDFGAAGGLVGDTPYLSGDSTIANVFAAGAVKGGYMSSNGGLVGNNRQ